MNVWTVFPTANPELAKRAIDRWHERGYKVAIYVDGPEIQTPDLKMIGLGMYPGYWASINRLIPKVLEGLYAGEDIVFIAAADDLDPDPNHTAQEIGQQYLERFPDGMGVMQPCGDKQGGELVAGDGTWNSKRICGSPIFGRGWVERANHGNGPMPTGYFHYWGDEFLFNSAKKQGVLWMNESLTHFHHHWSWGHRPIAPYNEKNQKHWDADAAQFLKDKADNFARGDCR